MEQNEYWFRISRDELYELVWSKSMVKLAQEFNLSDNGLRKICRKNNIPFPNLGYWAKKEHNKPVHQPPLPKLKRGEPSEIAIRKKRPSYAKNPIVYPPDVQALIDFEMKPENRIIVQERLASPHALVLATADCLKDALLDDKYNVLRFPTTKALDLVVGNANIRRALRIIDALLKALEKRGFDVSLESGMACAHILDEKIEFTMREFTHRSEKIFTEKELKEREKYSWMRDRTEYVFTPCGELSLIINRWAYRHTKKWSDAKNQLVEDVLNDFIIGLIKEAADKRAQRRERERLEQEWREQQRQREELAKRIKEEQARVQSLMRASSDWHKSRELRQYIEAFKDVFIKKYGVIEPDSETGTWLIWAQQQADRLDPLYDSPPSILDYLKEA